MKRYILDIFYILILGLILFLTSIFWWLNKPLNLVENDINLQVESNMNLRKLSQKIVKSGVHTRSDFLYYLFRFSGKDKLIKSGLYEIKLGTTPVELLQQLIQGGKVIEKKITFLEGWTFKQIRESLNANIDLKHETQYLSEEEIMQKLELLNVSAEGRFFPDTYHFIEGSSDLFLLKQAAKRMQENLEEIWQLRDENSPLKTQEEILILASIIEKETGHSEDRYLVAGVFINRLKIGMKLQTDPTIIYGMGDKYKGKIYKKNLKTDNPYNTYIRYGLPPTPIAIPGKESLLATVLPAETRALYFVAKGNGRSYFSETLAEHNRAVNLYIRNKKTIKKSESLEN